MVILSYLRIFPIWRPLTASSNLKHLLHIWIWQIWGTPKQGFIASWWCASNSGLGLESSLAVHLHSLGASLHAGRLNPHPIFHIKRFLPEVIGNVSIRISWWKVQILNLMVLWGSKIWSLPSHVGGKLKLLEFSFPNERYLFLSLKIYTTRRFRFYSKLLNVWFALIL